MDADIGARILAALSGVARQGRTAEAALLDGRDVPAPVVTVLGLLASGGELRLGRVAAGLGVDASVASRTVAHAQQLGLVSRRPDPGDGRACLLSLTPLGARCLTERSNRRLRMLTAVLDGWDPEAAQTLLAGLSRLQDDLAAYCRQAHVGPPPRLAPEALPAGH